MKYKIADNNKYLKVRFESSCKIYTRLQSRVNTQIYRNSMNELEDKAQKPIIANFYLSRKLEILNRLIAEAIPRL